MSLRPPRRVTAASIRKGVDVLDVEIIAEQAASLGRAGEHVEVALKRLKAHAERDEVRAVLLREATDAVYAYFIQRELCGLKRHDDPIREYGIPGEVLARLGAR